jgi:Mg/Co/Ni transporter MgtE
MSWLIVQMLWFGLAASIIAIDRQLVKKPLDPADLANVDLKDRSAAPFLGLMLIFGGFVIPFYLWYSRRSGAAVVAGVGLMIVCALIVGVLSGRLG